MKLITFEGIEGVGKSTQINLIHDWLLSSNFTVKLLREPGSTAFGEEIRNLLLSNDSDINYYTELLLMFAALSIYSVLIFLMKYKTEILKIKTKGLNRL